MKSITLIFFIFFSAGNLLAQRNQSSGLSSDRNPQDSLLFDGSGMYRTLNGCVWSDDCVIKVWEVKGTVIGTIIYDTVVDAGCMLRDTAKVCKRKQVSPR